VEKEEKILIKYAQADFCQRVYMFLQYRDLREDFQEIERTYFTVLNRYGPGHRMVYRAEQGGIV
jgi:hypothetical protein